MQRDQLRRNEHILVTGAPRTGTTFLGHVIAMAQGVGYVREPFNSDFGLKNLPHQFLYLYEGMEDEARFKRMAADLVDGRAVFKRMPVRKAKDRKQALGRAIFGSGSNYSYLKAKYNPAVSRYLLKDPMACLASEYLHKQLGVQVVIVVRHPMPTIASMRRVNLDHQLDVLVRQKHLYDLYLKDILGGVRLDRLSSLERRSLLWACLNYVMYQFTRYDDSYSIVAHGALSANPVQYARSLYAKLDLEFTPQIEARIRAMTEGENSPGRLTNSTMHVLNRNSRKLISRDYCKFDPGEERVIHSLTDDVVKLFYRSAEWPQPLASPLHAEVSVTPMSAPMPTSATS